MPVSASSSVEPSAEVYKTAKALVVAAKSALTPDVGEVQMTAQTGEMVLTATIRAKTPVADAVVACPTFAERRKAYSACFKMYCVRQFFMFNDISMNTS